MSDEIDNTLETHALDNAVPDSPEGSELQRVQGLIRDNDLRLQRLAQLHHIGIEPVQMVRIQLSALIEYQYGGEDDPRRLAFEEFLAGCVSKIIDGVESQAARATLLGGVSGAGLQVPEARSNGKRRRE